MITTIIFDFAGVISKRNFFPVVAENLSKKYGIPKEKILENLSTNVAKYIRGEESTEELWNKACVEFNIPYDDFVKIFSSAYELNFKMLELIKKLKENYDIYLLSDNFNALSQTLRKDENLKELFKKMYFSDEIHFIKEDEKAFRHMLNDSHKEARECIFVDDNELNLIESKKIGITTILFKDLETFENDLINLGIAV